MTNRKWYNSLPIEEKHEALNLICKDCTSQCDISRFVNFVVLDNVFACGDFCKRYAEEWLGKEHED